MFSGKMTVSSQFLTTTYPLADISKRRCPNKQRKTELGWPYTTCINPLSPVDRFPFFLSRFDILIDGYNSLDRNTSSSLPMYYSEPVTPTTDVYSVTDMSSPLNSFAYTDQGSQHQDTTIHTPSQQVRVSTEFNLTFNLPGQASELHSGGVW
jgi:hypothetical protein